MKPLLWGLLVSQCFGSNCCCLVTRGDWWGIGVTDLLSRFTNILHLSVLPSLSNVVMWIQWLAPPHPSTHRYLSNNGLPTHGLTTLRNYFVLLSNNGLPTHGLATLRNYFVLTSVLWYSYIGFRLGSCQGDYFKDKVIYPQVSKVMFVNSRGKVLHLH